jgi:hypothetical protein
MENCVGDPLMLFRLPEGAKKPDGAQHKLTDLWQRAPKAFEAPEVSVEQPDVQQQPPPSPAPRKRPATVFDIAAGLLTVCPRSR